MAALASSSVLGATNGASCAADDGFSDGREFRRPSRDGACGCKFMTSFQPPAGNEYSWLRSGRPSARSRSYGEVIRHRFGVAKSGIEQQNLSSIRVLFDDITKP